MQLGEHAFGADAWLDPARARELHLAHVPEDRHAVGLVMNFRPGKAPCSATRACQIPPGLGMNHAAMRSAAAEMEERFDVRRARWTSGPQSFRRQPAKLILAREIGEQPQVLLVGQPTRGVDIGAIEFIHARLRAMRDAGGAVLLVSSELDEILALATASS